MISILQKYSSNFVAVTCHEDVIDISILQKYSSNVEARAERGRDEVHFNTTKVLFKHDITAYTFYKAVIFQYYKSTLQTSLDPGTGEMTIAFISILQKYSSNICGMEKSVGTMG